MVPEYEDEGDAGVVTVTQPKQKTKRPPLYKVLMHNDDYTTREFVVWVLESVFQKTEPEAIRIMMHVHMNGVGVAGIYTREIAETKAAKTERMAREQEFPLRLTVEPEEQD
jgi:ATP-dependent Clp protease adaptor protein ClpS